MPRLEEGIVSAQINASELSRIVKEHEVRYEVWPDYRMMHGRKEQVGFQLELWGVNAHARPGGSGPGCPKCRETYEDLKAVAVWAAAEVEPGTVSIATFDGAWHESPQRGLRPEVVLALGVRGHSALDERVDDSVRTALRQIEGRLAQLHISKGS